MRLQTGHPDGYDISLYPDLSQNIRSSALDDSQHKILASDCTTDATKLTISNNGKHSRNKK